jgi:hypothetical protein
LPATHTESKKIPLQETTYKMREPAFVFTTKTIDEIMMAKAGDEVSTNTKYTSTSASAYLPKKKNTTTPSVSTTTRTSTSTTTLPTTSPKNHTTHTSSAITTSNTGTTTHQPLLQTTKSLKRHQGGDLKIPAAVEENWPFNDQRKRRIMPVASLDAVGERMLRRRMRRLMAHRRRMMRTRLRGPVQLVDQARPLVDNIYDY